ncbi:uncharacterized protein LOC110466399 [Mizuhopecten yessoensis]|uniref:Uncharacterized protein n=1 Tax=Mizuhopecten yessoensis TaxID=6573 RepID=A0A210R1V0_MIZYE|nr:uncharacterized protein LOC110466399 [Mizuhopecten yessoensis]XP_021378538.1 uncharacterized protein LOC110466399 [Mizuhopecten yessoensis]OWF54924.1 hypothetical protein KP79_PYT03882 [Mizuhopecten yessoensis]
MIRTIGFVLVYVTVYVTAVKEVSIPVSDMSEGTRCDKDLDKAGTCFQCSRLPEEIAVQLTTCCMEDKAYDVCERCVGNPKACLMDAYRVTGSDYSQDASKDTSEEMANIEYPDDPEIPLDKRFGTTFMGSSRYGYPRKRYGMLFLGRNKNRGGYRYGSRGKRYGTLNLGSGKGMLYRYGSDIKRADSSDEESMNKRYGTLNLGSGRGLRYRYGRYGKRSDDDDQDDNNESFDDNNDDTEQIEKRYGTLFMSRNGGRKRYGSLFMGKSRNW